MKKDKESWGEVIVTGVLTVVVAIVYGLALALASQN